MNFLKYVIAFIALLSAPAYAADTVYAKENIANHGYDVVAYFSLNADDEAVLGQPNFTAAYDGYIYHFSSAVNRDAFIATPNTYLPAYGGYCAYAVSAAQKKVKIDPNAWEISDGILYLNYSKSIQKKWLKDKPNHIVTADKVWPIIKDQKFKTGWF